MLKNTLNIYDYARDLENVDKEKIVVVGYSIGTGFATYLASQREVNGLILISPYDNALNLYNDNLNIFYGLLEKCRRYKLTSDIYAQNVETDPLIIASKMDEIIKYEHSVRLSEKFSKINKMVTLEDVGHQYFFEIPLVLEEMKEYLKERL